MALLAAAAWLVLAADPARLTLSHAHGDGCPDQAWLESNVAARLGYSPFVEGAPLQVKTKLECNAHECVGQLELTRAGSAPRQRSLSAPVGQCRELGESLALALSLAVDPQLLSRPAPEVKPPPPAPAPAPVVAPAPVAPPTPPPQQPRTPVFFEGALTGHASFGISPYATAGGSIAIGLTVSWFGLSLEGRADLPQGVSVSGGNVTSNTLLASVVPCGRYRGLGICLMVSAGALQVTGAIPGGNRQTSPLLLAGGRLMYDWMFLSWLGLRLHIDVEGVLTRTTVEAYDGPVWVTAPVAARAGLGLVAVF